VLVATFFIIGIPVWGIRLSFGVFFKSIETEFNLSRAATSTIFSAYMVLGCVFAPLGGWALDKYGPRILVLLAGLLSGLSLFLTSQTNSLWQLFFTYSLLLSVGTSYMHTVIASTITRWFEQKRGLALGIATSGGVLGTVIMAPVATYLITSLSWRMAYAILGAMIVLVLIPLSRLLKKDPYEIGSLPYSSKSHPEKRENKQDIGQPTSFSLFQAFRARSFWLLAFAFFFMALCRFLVITHLVPHAIDIGFSATKAARFLSTLAGFDIIGRVIGGIISDRIGSKLTIIIFLLASVAAMVWLIWARDSWMFYLFAAMFGLAWGSLSTSMTALIGSTFEVVSIGMIVGALDSGFVIGGAVGPAIGGLIYDVRQSYSIAFLLGAVALSVVTILVSLVRREISTGISSGIVAN